MSRRASLYGSPVAAAFPLRSQAAEFQSAARRRCLVHRLRRGQRSGRAEIVFDRNRRPHWQAQDFPTTRNSARQRLGLRVPAVPVHSRGKMMARLIGTAAIWVIRRCSRSSTNAMPAKLSWSRSTRFIARMFRNRPGTSRSGQGTAFTRVSVGNHPLREPRAGAVPRRTRARHL